MQQITGKDADKLYTLSFRLLTSPLDVSSQQRQLLVGQLPEDFPEEISFLQNTSIIGCILFPKERLQAIFEVAMPAHEVLMFHRQALAEVGREFKIGVVAPHSDERLQQLKDASLSFLLSQSWKKVFLTVAPLSSDLTDLRLNIYKYGIPKCP